MRTILNPLSETAWLHQVQGWMDALGWAWTHFNQTRREVAPGKWIGDKDAKGWPDLFAARGDRLLAVELKPDDPDRKPTPEQMAWLRRLEASGKVETFVWRPMDADEVLAVLSARGEPPVRSNLDRVSVGVRRPRPKKGAPMSLFE